MVDLGHKEWIHLFSNRLARSQHCLTIKKMSGRAKSRRKASHKARRLLKKLSKKKSKQSLKLVGLYPASLYSVYDGKAFVPRMLPIRPGQKTTLARSDPFFNLI